MHNIFLIPTLWTVGCSCSVHSYTLEPSKRARNDTCKSHDKVMMYMNKEPLGGEWMTQIVDIDRNGSGMEAWCSLETVNPLFVPGARSSQQTLLGFR